MTGNLRVALAQLAAGDDPDANLTEVGRQVTEATAAGARLVVFPEATMRRFGPGLAEVAEPADGPWATGLREVANRHEVVVAAGMFTPADGGRVHNTLRVVGGAVDASYDKIHLFDAFGFRESATVAPGHEPVVIKVDGFTVGLTTCYDIRFPGLYTRLADLGAQVVCVAASWAAGPGKVDQWRLLTRARALDSTTFLLAAGQADPTTVGLSPLRGSPPAGVGHSAVISPRGEVLGELGPEPGLLVADLDLTEITEARQAIPVLANRRF
jgi:deaminated glutathione amidase